MTAISRALAGGCAVAGTGFLVAAIVHANRPWAGAAIVTALILWAVAGAVALAVTLTHPDTATAEPVAEPRHHLADQPTEVLPRVRWHDLVTQQLPQVRGGRVCPQGRVNCPCCLDNQAFDNAYPDMTGRRR